MNKIKGLVAVSAFSLLLLGLPAVASAQWNGGYGGNGRYGGYGNNRGYNRNIKSTVKNLKERAERFEKAVDRRDDDDRYGRGRYGNWGGNRNGNYGRDLEDLADQFADATDDFEDAYGNGRNLDNSADEARRVLDIASAIDREIYNRGGRRGGLQGQWNSISRDLDIIADTYYGYNGNYRNNRNNRRNRNGDWRNNIPFPFPF
ncbi:MAG: hypothetical protein AB7F88_11940 [Pyrinomonadaceae bacterium]